MTIKDKAAELRQRAEEQLLRNPVTASKDAPESLRLLHEMQVHQIELEIQNQSLLDTQAELENALARYTDLYEFAPVGYVTLDSAGRIEEINLTAATLLGAERMTLWQSRFTMLVSREDADAWHRFLVSMQDDGGETRRTVELSLLRHDGRTFPAQLDCVRIITGSTAPRLRVAVTDITARRQAETDRHAAVHREYLRRLAVEATLAEARERQAIAMDLHDGLGQVLHVARIKLDALTKGLSPDSASRALAHDLDGLIADASREIRAMVSKLSPPALLDLGLLPAMSWLVEEMQRGYGLTVTVEDDGAPKPLTPAQTAVLFRAVRELLINVSKHARVDTARVVARARDGRLFLSVEDMGIGLTNWRAAIMAGKGFGLYGVHERIIFFKGAMGIQTEPGGGTTVILEMPFASPETTP